MISLDSETTGVDFRHGARPFFVTTCMEDGEQQWWEWSVDPLTRMPEVPVEDVEEIARLVSSGKAGKVELGPALVLQNAKFDVTALSFIGVNNWNWTRTHDTLIAGHLLASNKPHDLTSMAIQYLGVDIEPYEKKLEAAVKECRRLVQQARLRVKRMSDPDMEDALLADWRIAEAGLKEMPSAKETTWRYDYWLPRAMAKHQQLEEDHPWWTVLSDYANADSATTISLWGAMKQELDRRGLWEIYLERMKVLPVAYAMECRGVTISKTRLDEMVAEYEEEEEKAGNICVGLAASYGHELELPKSGNNNSLRTCLFDVMKVPGLAFSEKTGQPTLDKNTMEAYLDTLEERSKPLLFIKKLGEKRKRDTAISYMEGYKRFWRPLEEKNDGEPRATKISEKGTKNEDLLDVDGQQGSEGDWSRLHPSLNITGTDTLRWSSNHPNSQNVSKKEDFNLRYCFGPVPGREWWSLDAKNIELRIPAYESGEKELIDLFERPDDPPYYGSTHLLNLSTVYEDLWERELREVGLEKVGPYIKKKYAATWYQYTKNGDFAIQYGAQQATTDRAFHRAGSYDRLKSRFSKLEVLNQKWIRFAEKHGYVETLPDKTVNPKHGYPLLCTRTEYGRILPTVPLNYHVSGTAMWWMGKAMVRCFEYLKTLKDAYLILQVHDELVFDFPFKPKMGNLPKVRTIQRLMQKGGEDIGIPTPVSIEYHTASWAEGVSI